MYELVLQFLTQIFGLMYSVLTEDLSDFSPHAYEYISILNTILKGFASSLMLVAFCVGYIQSAVSLIEQKTPIAIFKTLARLVIVNALVVRGTDIILMPMFSVVRSLTSRLIEAMGGQAGLLPNIDESSPGGVAGAIGELLSINILPPPAPGSPCSRCVFYNMSSERNILFTNALAAVLTISSGLR